MVAAMRQTSNRESSLKPRDIAHVVLLQSWENIAHNWELGHPSGDLAIVDHMALTSSVSNLFNLNPLGRERYTLSVSMKILTSAFVRLGE